VITNIDRHGHFVDGYLKRMMSKERSKKKSLLYWLQCTLFWK